MPTFKKGKPPSDERLKRIHEWLFASDVPATEYKVLPVFVKQIDEAQGVVTAIVSVIGNVDDGDDVIMPGAFTKTIVERARRFRVLDQHRTDSLLRVVGKPLQVREIGRDELPDDLLDEFPQAQGGLETVTQFLINTPEGDGVFKRLAAGAVDEWSIGYDPLDVDYIEWEFPNGDKRAVRALRTIRLWEYSPVIWGMNPATTTVGVKSVNGAMDLSLASRDRDWDADAAEGRVRNWAGGEDDMDWAKYRKAFFWYDGEDPELFTSYKLGFADVIGGELKAVPRGIFAVAAVLQGARGGVDIPENDQSKIKTKVERYYSKMRREFDDDSIVVPWEQDSADTSGITAKAFLSVIEQATAAVLGEPLEDKEIFNGMPVARVGDHLQGIIHQHFTMAADEMFSWGLLSQDERKVLSFAIGEALDRFKEAVPRKLYRRGLYGGDFEEADELEELLGKQSKAGRVLSAANARALKAAYEALGDVLDRAGVFDEAEDDGDDEDAKALAGPQNAPTREERIAAITAAIAELEG